MLRAALLYLSERRGLRDRLLRRRFARAAARRFVAGDTLDEAIQVARGLNARGMRVSLDFLGESVTSVAEAERATEAHLEAVERIAADGVRASLSLKLTQLGLDLDETLCATHLARVVGRAERHGIFVRIDMERSRHVDATLRLHRRLFAQHRNLGVVLQSCLRRSESDARECCALGAPVRVVKGAYREPESVAFPRKRDVDVQYVRLVEILLRCGVPVAVATHDERIIERAKEMARARGLGPAAPGAPPEAADGPVPGAAAPRSAAGPVPAAAARAAPASASPLRDARAAHPFDNPPFEFQMLYGVRRDLQERLVAEGWEVRVYVPYGTDWYPYFMRRLAERPANVTFLLRALWREFGRR